MIISFETENRAYYNEAIEAMMVRRTKYQRAVKAEVVAFIMKAYCPKGQDVPYETLKKLYEELRR